MRKVALTDEELIALTVFLQGVEKFNNNEPLSHTFKMVDNENLIGAVVSDRVYLSNDGITIVIIGSKPNRLLFRVYGEQEELQMKYGEIFVYTSATLHRAFTKYLESSNEDYIFV